MSELLKASSGLLSALSSAGAYFLCSEKYPGYFVSPDGRVFSQRSMKFLSPIRCGKYLAVGLKDSAGNSVRRYVHRLVAELSHGACFDGMDVCHNDGNRDNNAESNIRWDTRAANHADKKIHGTDACGERNGMARLTARQVSEIRSMVSAGAKQRDARRLYGVSPMTVSRIVRGESWRAA